LIPVTKPFLPPIEKYNKYIEGIWERNWLTNSGPLVNELELQLKEYLEVPHLLYLGNGTIAIQMAIKALKLKGEIITTPFSYVATTSTIVWENCKPVFVDINPHTLNIDPNLIENKITEKTSAILATHVYGNPCEIDKIEEIANKHNLKVIYDAAHCFGSTYKEKSVFQYGDISTSSFHATKIFHTIEGGAVFCNDPDVFKILAFLRNFGHDGPEKFASVGINGKNSEFHAAMGLVNLTYMQEILERRKLLCDHYDRSLKGLRKQQISTVKNGIKNYSYYPIVLESVSMTEKIIEILNDHLIYPRRYFYPTLNKLEYLDDQFSCPESEDISSRVLCLPLYHSLSIEEVDYISRLVLRAQNN
jgi:dTDP-4-amino-4,6-dideoxygalactose transaminase